MAGVKSVHLVKPYSGSKVNFVNNRPCTLAAVTDSVVANACRNVFSSDVCSVEIVAATHLSWVLKNCLLQDVENNVAQALLTCVCYREFFVTQL